VTVTGFILDLMEGDLELEPGPFVWLLARPSSGWRQKKGRDFSLPFWNELSEI